MNNIFETAKKRIEMQNESKAKEFAISVCFDDISSCINYYTTEAIESNASLGDIADLYLNKIKNRLFDCVLNSELNELLTDSIKAKSEIFNRISNSYENQYKIEFNFFSFKQLTFFDWSDKSDALLYLKYYLEYKEICEQINRKLKGLQEPLQNNNSDFETLNNYQLLNNSFDDVKPIKVVGHFKQLVENGYITQTNLNDFLSTVFEKNEILPSQIEILKRNSKIRVQKIFYDYYDKCTNKYGGQEKYINLLCDNFIGFNKKSLSTNFSK